jgi:hypothetical protein
MTYSCYIHMHCAVSSAKEAVVAFDPAALLKIIQDKEQRAKEKSEKGKSKKDKKSRPIVRVGPWGPIWLCHGESVTQKSAPLSLSLFSCSFHACICMYIYIHICIWWGWSAVRRNRAQGLAKG